MTDNTKPSTNLPIPLGVLNGLLLVITLILGVATFFSIMNIIISIGTFVAIRSTDSVIAHAKIAANLRNFWALIGGGALIVFIIGTMEYHLKRLDKEKTRFILTRTLLVEVVIIILGLLV